MASVLVMQRPMTLFKAAVLTLTLAGCGEQPTREEFLREGLSMFVAADVLTPAEAAYLASVAADEGVRRIRPMREAEKPRRLVGAQTGCGMALSETREVLIDADRARCLNIGNIIHEIAHIPMFQRNCHGHGDRFYQKNYQLAAAFEAQFPRWGTRVTRGVIRRSQEYRNGEARCRGSVDITS